MLRIPGNAAFPLTKRIDLGIGRSIIVEFPVPLKDVLVSDPQLMDAVVQSSDRVFLIAKKSGQTNAFFFDEYGQQILTLEVAVGADLSSLDQLLARLIPGSSIHSEIAGQAVVLTGSVRTPIDSDRAAQIAAQFVAANAGAIGSINSGGTTNNTTTNTTTSSTTNVGAGGATAAYQNQVPSTVGPSASGSDNPYASKPIINLLAVEGEEQVMLRVSVAEVQRSVLKQFGINLGAFINSGNFTTAILSDNAFPLTSAAGLGTLPTAGIRSNALNLFNTGPTGTDLAGTATTAFGNSGVAGLWSNREPGHCRRLARARARRTD